MVELEFLGTGGSIASVRRDNTSFLVRSDRGIVLVDCPGSVVQKIKKTGIDPLEVDAILITHIHTDHIYGLPSLVHTLMMEDLSVKLVGSGEAVHFCRELLHMFGLLREKIKYRLEFISLEAGDVYKLPNGMDCRAHDVPHCSSSLAFRLEFEGGDKSLVYSGDTPIHPPLFQWAEGSNYLIHDCGAPRRIFDKDPHLITMHTHSLDLGKYAQRAGVQCLIPCHIFGEMDFEDNELEEEIKQSFRGQLIIPEDFQTIPLV